MFVIAHFGNHSSKDITEVKIIAFCSTREEVNSVLEKSFSKYVKDNDFEDEEIDYKMTEVNLSYNLYEHYYTDKWVVYELKNNNAINLNGITPISIHVIQ